MCIAISAVSWRDFRQLQQCAAPGCEQPKRITTGLLYSVLDGTVMSDLVVAMAKPCTSADALVASGL